MRSNGRWLRRRVYESPLRLAQLGLGAQLSERQRLNVLPPQRPLFTPRLDLTVGVWKACGDVTVFSADRAVK